MKFTTILVPTDYSDNAEAALEVAWSLAKTMNARIQLVHVAAAAPYFGPPFAPSIAKELNAVSHKVFDAYMDQVHARGVDATGVLAEGVPHREINRVAMETGADLVVIGTHGRGGIEHALLGSVAERVVRTSKIPVLVIPSVRQAAKQS